jgi:hypothetical protein
LLNLLVAKDRRTDGGPIRDQAGPGLAAERAERVRQHHPLLRRLIGLGVDQRAVGQAVGVPADRLAARVAADDPWFRDFATLTARNSDCRSGDRFLAFRLNRIMHVLGESA